MLLFAVTTTLEKIQRLPVQFWLKAALVIVVFIAGVILLRKLAGMNKAVLAAILLVVGTALGFSWIYERNEPAWATPVVEKLAWFFPTKNTAQKHIEAYRQ
jgi:hypothetical protein